MATKATMIAAAAVLTLALLGPAGSALGGEESRELAVPTEAALWEAAGTAYEAGVDKSAAMQQYRLFVQTYGGSERAASAQYMVGECYFAAEDYEGALREYAKVSGRKGRDEFWSQRITHATPKSGDTHHELWRKDYGHNEFIFC